MNELLYKYGSNKSFWLFCLYYDNEFFIKRPFLKKVALAFQKIFDREITSLSVSMPPRAGKSYITSLFCAWTLGMEPSETVMRNTCTATLYNKFSYDVRDILRSIKFSNVFPKIKLSEDKANVQGWNTNYAKQVSYFGGGVGGTIIGFGATRLSITDDLYRSMEDALSETYNEKVSRWIQATHDSRTEKGCCAIDIGTRWSVRDIIGSKINDFKYDESIIIPALDEHDQSFCEDVQTTEYYIAKRKETDKSIWLSAYQQEPIEAEGLLFPLNELQFYDKLPEDIEGKTIYIDVADEGADYLCAVLGEFKNGNTYISDVLFTRDKVELTLPDVLKMIERHKPNYVIVESNNQGRIFTIQLIKENPHSGFTKIIAKRNTTNKATRILYQAGKIKNNFFFKESYKQEQNYSLYIKNLCSYLKDGKNKHDDAADATAGLSIFTK